MKIAVVPSSNKEIDKYTSPLVSTIIFGLKDFSVNYPELSLEEIKNFSLKNKDIDIFVSINKTIFNEDLESVERYLIELDNLSIKGVLFYDLGILNIYKRHKFKYSLVWHQTHMVTNYNTCNYYYNEGVQYGVIAGEITKDEIIEIKNKTKMKLFVTLIARPIMAHSRRKLLSNYYKSIDKNYDGKIKTIKEGLHDYLIKEDENGTCILEDKIVNGLTYINKFNDNKIEYGIINGMELGDELLLELIPLVNEVLNNNDKKSLERINGLIGNNTLFFDKKTVFKVKKDEKKN